MAERRLKVALAVAVGVVLADSSIVVLALPDIYRDLDVSVTAAVWVLVSFNLVLALAAVPAAHLAARRRGPGWTTVSGMLLFTAASLICGEATGIVTLLIGRCLQASGGAMAVCGALELMPSVYGSERRAATAWAAAGAAGAALGPGLGGLLTELVAWQAIFFVQVPVALGCAYAIGPVARDEPRRGAGATAGRPHFAANLALALISAALTAALFLVVLLLIEGWRLSPIGAAAAVTVMPICAVLAAPLTRRVPAPDARAAAGVILIAGGLGGLALLPDAAVTLTFAPQALVGAGLALTLSALTEAALEGRSPQAIHGGWTIAARHAGVVAGLLVLTPVFTADLETERAQAEQAGTAALLDSRLPPSAIFDLAERIATRIEQEGEKVPVLGPAFEPLPGDPSERAETLALRASIEDEIDRAATHAFSASFLIAAGFALAALAPIAIVRRRIQL